MRDFRVLITHKCNANCPTCFNKSIRHGAEMSLDDFVCLADYLAESGVQRIKIMGGEPTVHPCFSEIICYAQKRFYSVHVFTNAINDKILDFVPREHDSIIYNVSCLPTPIQKCKMMLDRPGGRMFETQIAADAPVNLIKRKLEDIVSVVPKEKLAIALTLNCMENIFAKKAEIIEKWNIVADYLHETLGVTHHIDHKIPFCFFQHSGMRVSVVNSLCSTKCAGLITPDVKLQYCNQLNSKPLSIKGEKGFLPYEIIENYLQQNFYLKMSTNLNKICADCILFNKKCNGGCFMHKNFISGEDVIASTDFPTM